jgi:hypothetical protein
MTEDKDTVAERVCRLPVDFRTIRTVSSIALVQNSGYLERPTDLTRKSVLGVLRKSPSLIDEWLLWSENQRTTPAWAFYEVANGYRVHLVGGDEEMVFTDKFEACAEFVMRQIQSIARFTEKTST